MRARDIMVTEFDRIGLDRPLLEAIGILRARKLDVSKAAMRVILVVDEKDEPRHLLTEADVIRAILPFFFRERKFADFVNKWLARDLPEESLDEVFRDLARAARKKLVKDVGFPDAAIISVDEEDSVLKIAHTMHSERVKTLPVTRAGKIVGILFRGAVFEVIAAEMEKGRPPSNPTIPVPGI